MATILIVDDRKENREFLVTLLGYGGHRLLEADDGAAALALARREQPDLIISDVLMPTMDGYEFVRRLRSDAELNRTTVIFTTAHYLDREAVELARACGVEQVIPKPSEPEVVLEIVAEALRAGAGEVKSVPQTPDFDRDHFRVVSDKLREKTNELRGLSEKMAALIDLIQRAALERDPRYLLEDFCKGARRIIGAQHGAMYAVDNNGSGSVFFTSGLEVPAGASFAAHRPQAGPLAVLLTHPGSLRLRTPSGDPRSVGLPAGYPAVRCVTAASVVSPTHSYGWLCLSNKLGFDDFDEDDERLIRILGAQLGRMYENGKLYRELQQRTVELELEIQERRRSEVRFRSLIENGSDLISAIDTSGVLQYASPSHHPIFGFGPEELVGRDAFAHVFPADRERVLGAFARLVTTGGRVTMEFRHAHRDGSWRVIEAIASNLLDDPAIAAVVLNSRDITDRKAAEDRTATLLELATSVVGSDDLESLVDRVERRIASALPCDFVATLYHATSDETLRVVNQSGVPAHLRALSQALERTEAEALRRRVTSGEASLVDNRGGGDELATRFGLDSLIIAPLRMGRLSRGAILAGRTSPGRPFAPEHLELCRGIAAQLATRIEVLESHLTQREEAEVSAAVAQAGENLIEGLDSAALIERVCRVTGAVLECDVTWAVLLNRERTAYVPLAVVGATPEQLEEAKVLRFTTDSFDPLFALLGEQNIVQVDSETPQGPLDPLALRFGSAVTLYVPLRRGSEVIGVLAAGLRDRDGKFSPVRERIARRLGHLASLALEPARLIERLEEANRLKSDFVATISHELRTPMNIIMGYSELLREEAYGPLNEEQQTVFRSMDRSARQLLELINATLDLSRLEAGRLPRSIQVVDPAALLAEVRAESAHLEKPGVHMTWQPSKSTTALHTDRVKLKVVLSNLLQNAVKFTEAGEVSVRTSNRRGGLELSVTDTGIGIGTDALAIIFEPFRQAEEALTRHYGGVGLGLYLVRRILDLLEGTITVESELGRGSTFHVWVPNLDEEEPRRALEAGR